MTLGALPEGTKRQIAFALPAHDMLALGQTAREWRSLSVEHPDLRAALAWPDPALCVTARVMARKCTDMHAAARARFVSQPYFFTLPDAYQLRPYGSAYPVVCAPVEQLQQVGTRAPRQRVQWLIEQRISLQDRIASARRTDNWLDDQLLSEQDRRFWRCPMFTEPSTPSEPSRVASLLLQLGAEPSTPIALLGGLTQDDEDLCDVDASYLDDGGGVCSVLSMLKDANFDDPCSHWVRVVSPRVFEQQPMLVEHLWAAAVSDSEVAHTALMRGFSMFARSLLSELDLPGTLVAALQTPDGSGWNIETLVSWHLARLHGWDAESTTIGTATGKAPLREHLRACHGDRADLLFAPIAAFPPSLVDLRTTLLSCLEEFTEEASGFWTPPQICETDTACDA